MGPTVRVDPEVGELRVQDAELVAPGVVHDPEVEAAFLLMIPAGGAECFQAFDFGVWRRIRISESGSRNRR